MLKVLIVEDDHNKLKKISNSIQGVRGIDLDNIDNVIDARTAKLRLSEQFFDMLIVDIAIPNKISEEVKKDAGINLINEILERDIYKMPTHIIAVTAFPEILETLSKCAAEKLIPFLYCDVTSDGWVRQLQSFVDRAMAAKRHQKFEFGNYGSYLAIVCALETPELQALLHNGWEWQSLRMPNDATIYYQATVNKNGAFKQCFTAAAPRKGMPASAVLAIKMITTFRPKYLAMVGITSGYSGKTKYGNVIAADPVWDWGSGKLISRYGKTLFEPEPHQLDLEVNVRTQLKLMANDVTALAQIRSEWPAEKPDHELSVQVGPAASGSAVLADAQTHQRILKQHRGLLGIEMETYAVFCAAQESPMPRPTVFSLKSVVDFADAAKDNRYQNYGAYTSAEVLRLFVEKYL